MALKLVATYRVIDRTGVDQVSAEDRAEDNYHTAKAILAEMKGCLNSTDDEWTESCGGIASELAQTDYDKSGFWCPPEEDEDDPALSWAGLRNGVILGAIIWGGLIWLVLHYAHKWGLPW